MLLIENYYCRIKNLPMDIREQFFTKLSEISSTQADNCCLFSESKILQIIHDVKEAKTKDKKSSKDYRRLQRFEIIKIGDCEEKLIKRSSSGQLKYYVSNEEMYDVINLAHIATGHGGRDRLLKETSRQYANVTRDAVVLFLSYCKECQLKKKAKRRALAVKKFFLIMHSVLKFYSCLNLLLHTADFASKHTVSHRVSALRKFIP